MLQEKFFGRIAAGVEFVRRFPSLYNERKKTRKEWKKEIDSAATRARSSLSTVESVNEMFSAAARAREELDDIYMKHFVQDPREAQEQALNHMLESLRKSQKRYDKSKDDLDRFEVEEYTRLVNRIARYLQKPDFILDK